METSGDYLVGTLPNPFHPWEAFTVRKGISLWYRKTVDPGVNFPTFGMFVCTRLAPNDYLILDIDSAGRLRFRMQQTPTRYLTKLYDVGSILLNGGWHFLTMTQSQLPAATPGTPLTGPAMEAATSVWLDGILLEDYTTDHGDPIIGEAAPNSDFFLGGVDFNNGIYVRGRLDEVVVWNAIPDDDQVQALYNGGNPVDPNTVLLPDNWWRMGEFFTSSPIVDQQATMDLTLSGTMGAGNFVGDSP